jgi:hypothetical protein
MEFYERFSQLCEEKRIKPTPLMHELHFSSSNVTRWKAGSTIASDMLIVFAQYFNVSTDYLLGVTDVRLPFNYSESQIISGSEEDFDEIDLLIIEKLKKLSLSDKIKKAAFILE